MKLAGVLHLASTATLLLAAPACQHAKAVAPPTAPESAAVVTLLRESHPPPGARADRWPVIDGDDAHPNRDKGGRFVWDREMPNTNAPPTEATEASDATGATRATDAGDEQRPSRDQARTAQDAGKATTAKR